MPEAPSLQQAPRIVESGPPKPPPAPTSEIHVNPAVIDKGPAQAPPKKGSAQERMFESLRKRAKPQFFESAEPTSPADSTPNPDPSQLRESGTPPEGVAEPENTSVTPTSTENKDKKNPWKLVDEYKAKAAKTEARLKEIESGAVTPEKVKEFQTQMETLRKQNEELEKEIRFTNYSKSEEFKTKYQQPYEKSWARAAKELSEITVATAEGERPATVNDLAEIVNLPLGKARQLAEQAFGAFADDVMGYRKEILGLYEQQAQALQEARNKSIERDKLTQEQAQRLNGELTKTISETWQKANEKIVSDPKMATLFKKVEGDQDGNDRLDKGFKLVDAAFSENPNDPNMTPEQRASVVERHAAVRLRAAAFGRCNAQRVRAEARVAELEKALAGYRGSVPPTGGTSGPGTAAAPSTSGWNGLRTRLQQKAVQR